MCLERNEEFYIQNRGNHLSATRESWIPCIIMSDSDLKEADGCDVFLSFIIVLIFCWFFHFQILNGTGCSFGVDYKTDQKRIETVAEHKSLNATYNAKINTFHAETNSSIEKVMNSVINHYQEK